MQWLNTRKCIKLVSSMTLHKVYFTSHNRTTQCRYSHQLPHSSYIHRSQLSCQSFNKHIPHGHFFSTQLFPPSSYSCFEIHICWNEPYTFHISTLSTANLRTYNKWYFKRVIQAAVTKKITELCAIGTLSTFPPAYMAARLSSR
jgi:hypothetical protein